MALPKKKPQGLSRYLMNRATQGGGVFGWIKFIAGCAVFFGGLKLLRDYRSVKMFEKAAFEVDMIIQHQVRIKSFICNIRT